MIFQKNTSRPENLRDQVVALGQLVEQLVCELKKVKKERDDARAELELYQTNFDQENMDLHQRLRESSESLVAANQHIATLSASLKKKAGPGFALNLPQIDEMYEEEFMNHVVCALMAAVSKGKGKNCSCFQRNLDVWQAILDANPEAVAKYRDYCRDRDELVDYARKESLSSPKAQPLLRKFKIVCEKKSKRSGHYSVSFHGYQGRYTVIEACTGSDQSSGGMNEASAFERAFFCSHQ